MSDPINLFDLEGEGNALSDAPVNRLLDVTTNFNQNAQTVAALLAIGPLRSGIDTQRREIRRLMKELKKLCIKDDPYGLKRELKGDEMRVREMILDQLKDQLVQALNRVNGMTPGKAIGLQK